jgi:uncharacterized protein YbbC (DUF1343 family)
VRAAVALLEEFRRQSPTPFPWRQPPYEYEHGKMPIDILSGDPRLRQALDAGETADTIVASWRDELTAFASLRQRYLLY